MSPGLFQELDGWVYKILRLPNLLNKLRVPRQGYSRSMGYNCGVPVMWALAPILRVANFRFLLYEICIQNQWIHRILRP